MKPPSPPPADASGPSQQTPGAPTSRVEDLHDLELTIWQELAAATRQRGHEWRVGVLATVARGEPDARNVVLRDLRADSRAVLIYTDARSPKARQIAEHPRGVLVLWSRSLGWQLRLQCDLTLESSGLEVSSRWARMRMTPAAQDYLSPLPPGTPLAHPQPERGTRENFAIVTARVRSIDWLELHPEGHRRALIDNDGRRWITP
jgi:pyridoxamine 5'-phosphate oxidase